MMGQHNNKNHKNHVDTTVASVMNHPIYSTHALIHASVADDLILQAGKLSVATFLILLTCLYVFTPNDEIMELKKSEQDAAKIAFWMMSLSICTLLTPYLSAYLNGKPKKITKIFIVTLIINFTSWTTNGLLAWAPVVTKMDPVLNTRVYLMRYCEWVPLAGLMTFLSDIVDCPRSQGTYMPLLVGLSQTVSVFAGMMFPYCGDNFGHWMFWMILSVGLYLVMFPRLWYKYHVLRNTTWGDNKVDMERYERLKFSFQLIFLCTIVWTILVVMYFLNGALRKYLPEGHVFRHEALGMFVDCTFDVIAKSFYQRLLMEIHTTVFENYAS